jgi:hypothetical protein
MPRKLPFTALAVSLGLLMLACGALGAAVGVRWAARRPPAPAPEPTGEDTCPSDTWQVASLRARVELLERLLAAASVPPSPVAAETDRPPSEEGALVEAVPGTEPVPVPMPQLPASTPIEEAWVRAAQDRLMEVARSAGASGESAGVTCNRDECRVEVTAPEGELPGERVHKILSGVLPYLHNVNVESDEMTGKTTMVFSHRAVAEGG